MKQLIPFFIAILLFASCEKPAPLDVPASKPMVQSVPITFETASKPVKASSLIITQDMMRNIKDVGFFNGGTANYVQFELANDTNNFVVSIVLGKNKGVDSTYNDSTARVAPGGIIDLDSQGHHRCIIQMHRSYEAQMEIWTQSDGFYAETKYNDRRSVYRRIQYNIYVWVNGVRSQPLKFQFN